jgi:hypothetical protein
MSRRKLFVLFFHLKTLPCKLLGRHLLIEDKDKMVATCDVCRKSFLISYDMTYGETVILREMNCGKYACQVDPKYGFVPEAGCPIHD